MEGFPWAEFVKIPRLILLNQLPVLKQNKLPKKWQSTRFAVTGGGQKLNDMGLAGTGAPVCGVSTVSTSGSLPVPLPINAAAASTQPPVVVLPSLQGRTYSKSSRTIFRNNKSTCHPYDGQPQVIVCIFGVAG